MLPGAAEYTHRSVSDALWGLVAKKSKVWSRSTLCDTTTTRSSAVTYAEGRIIGGSNINSCGDGVGCRMGPLQG